MSPPGLERFPMAEPNAGPEVPTRFASHQDVLPLDLIRPRHFTIAGCGSVGSVLGRLLARLGAHRFHLIDGAEVEERDLNRQVFRKEHVGMNKAAALAMQLNEVHPKVRSITSARPLDAQALVPGKQDILILATDDPELPGHVLSWLEPWEPADRPTLWVLALRGSRGGYWFHDLKQGIPDEIPEPMLDLLTYAADKEPNDRPVTIAYATAALAGQAITTRLNIQPVKHLVTFDLADMVAGAPEDLVIGVGGERPNA